MEEGAADGGTVFLSLRADGRMFEVVPPAGPAPLGLVRGRPGFDAARVALTPWRGILLHDLANARVGAADGRSVLRKTHSERAMAEVFESYEALSPPFAASIASETHPNAPAPWSATLHATLTLADAAPRGADPAGFDLFLRFVATALSMDYLSGIDAWMRWKGDTLAPGAPVPTNAFLPVEIAVAGDDPPPA